MRLTIELEFEVPVRDDGDVNARVWIRIREVEQSLRLIEQIVQRLPSGPIRRRSSAPAEPGEGLALVEAFRGDVLVSAAARRRWQDRALPSARPVLVPVAAARGLRRRQHRRRLPALQQIVQLLLFGPRSLEGAMRLVFKNMLSRPVTEAAPAPDDAGLAELAANLDRAAKRRLGRSLADPRGRCRLVQWLRAGNPRAEQRLLRSRAVRAEIRRLAAPCRRAAGDRPGHQEHARGAAAHL